MDFPNPLFGQLYAGDSQQSEEANLDIFRIGGVHLQQQPANEQPHHPRPQSAYYRGTTSRSGTATYNHAASERQQQQQQQQQRLPIYHHTRTFDVASSVGRRAPLSPALVDDAVRRLGRRLSLQAHGASDGGGGSKFAIQSSCRIPIASTFYHHEDSSSFVPLSHNPHTDHAFSSGAHGASDNQQPSRRTTKVAKTNYSDHGDHHLLLSTRKADQRTAASTTSLLRKLTLECKDHFSQWETKRKLFGTSNASQSRNIRLQLSPQQKAFANLALETSSIERRHTEHHHERVDLFQPAVASAQQQNSREQRLLAQDTGIGMRVQQDTTKKQRESDAFPPIGIKKGLLSAILEGQITSTEQSDSNLPQQLHIDNLGRMRGDAGVPMMTAQVGSPLLSSDAGSNPSQLSRGRCLTNPSVPSDNGSLDNCDGNLIVHEFDTIFVPPNEMRTMSQGDFQSRNTSYEFRVQGLQGQGTFAQVFECLHVQSGRIVALKVVKSKPAYTRQAAIEIDIFQSLQGSGMNEQEWNENCLVNLECYFMYQNHLCLVFELLGLNLYEVLKKRQFRGLPLKVVRSIVQQSLQGILSLTRKNVVHCDLKPENILLTSEHVNERVIGAGDSLPLIREKHTEGQEHLPSSKVATSSDERSGSPIESWCKIKVIDFGSACFEGYTAHTYIQSRFYRSPEVVVGFPYDSAIDIWSLGCIAAELFLGLPILPGVHEHDQVGRIAEMIGRIPDWMLYQGTKSSKYFVEDTSRQRAESFSGLYNSRNHSADRFSEARPPRWRLKTQQEYIESLSTAEIERKGGLERLNRPQGNRYFNRSKLSDILILHGKSNAGESAELWAFVHFLYGLLDPDPWKRFTAFQAVQHPFLTGDLSQFKRKTHDSVLKSTEENQANMILDIHWSIPWDPSICRRKLLNVQNTRDVQQALSLARSSVYHAHDLRPNEMLPQSNNRTSSSPPSQKMPIPSFSLDILESVREFSGASSWTGHEQPRHQLQPVAGSFRSRQFDDTRTDRPTGPQSFHEENHSPMATDLAYALQRPGVFPAGQSAHSMQLSQYEPAVNPSRFQANGVTSRQDAVSGTRFDDEPLYAAHGSRHGMVGAADQVTYNNNVPIVVDPQQFEMLQHQLLQQQQQQQREQCRPQKIVQAVVMCDPDQRQIPVSLGLAIGGVEGLNQAAYFALGNARNDDDVDMIIYHDNAIDPSLRNRRDFDFSRKPQKSNSQQQHHHQQQQRWAQGGPGG